MKPRLCSPLLLTTLLLTSSVLGTQQMPDRISYEGKQYSLWASPLEDYFRNGHTRPKMLQEYGVISSGNWKGYVAEWTILDGRLFLGKVMKEYLRPQAATQQGRRDVEWRAVPARLIFPNAQYPIFAEWFSGTLQIPIGVKLAESLPSDLTTSYDKAVNLIIVSGRITNVEKRTHVAAPPAADWRCRNLGEEGLANSDPAFSEQAKDASRKSGECP